MFDFLILSSEKAEQLEEGLSDKEVAIAAVSARLHEKEVAPPPSILHHKGLF